MTEFERLLAAFRGGNANLVAGRKGPEMVVVPAGDGLDKTYAIGKYAVSVVDFNHFCEQGQRCSARRSAERRLPVTGNSLADARSGKQNGWGLVNYAGDTRVG